jgi:hypothetical protein
VPVRRAIDVINDQEVQARLRRNQPRKRAKIIAGIGESALRGRRLDVYAALGARDAVARDLYPPPRRDDE